MAELTSKERSLRILQRQEPDRVAHFEWLVDRQVCYQFVSILRTPHCDPDVPFGRPVVGGGATKNKFWMQNKHRLYQKLVAPQD